MAPVVVDRYYRTMMKKLTVNRIVLGILLACALLIYMKSGSNPRRSQAEGLKMEKKRLTYMLHGDNLDSGYLKHVRIVLERLGYERVRNSSDFDLLWSHVYPFGDRIPFPKAILQSLAPHQKVNHFPGSGFFTNKVDLATSDLKHVPRAFHLPKQKQNVMEYARANPQHLFVQKSNSHRGIKILKIEDMDMDKTGTFVQEYVQDPLLVDGRKFDVGVYTILTSVDPLRVYIYDGDVLLRFCAKKYEPFDPEDVDKYVVGDDYVPIWDMPSLKKSYRDLKYGMRETLNIYLRSKGENPMKIWDQIEESIRTVFLKKESNIIQIVKRYKNVGNFFEMVRFDFVVDANLDVYLMEANMSPNLSSEHFPANRVLYENVLFNLFSLVGVGRVTTWNRKKSQEEEEMEAPLKALVVMGDKCSEAKCQHCGSPYCILCKNCLTRESLRNLRLAYLEHVNKKDCKRIFPPTLSQDASLEDLNLEEYSPENRFMVSWFLGKCHQDITWC